MGGRDFDAALISGAGGIAIAQAFVRLREHAVGVALVVEEFEILRERGDRLSVPPSFSYSFASPNNTNVLSGSLSSIPSKTSMRDAAICCYPLGQLKWPPSDAAQKILQHENLTNAEAQGAFDD